MVGEIGGSGGGEREERSWWLEHDLLIFGGMRICMADFGWRASFGESAEGTEGGVGREGTARLGNLSTTQDRGAADLAVAAKTCCRPAGRLPLPLHAKSKRNHNNAARPVLRASVPTL